MVDDQEATFTADILRQIKLNHEVWVSEKLTSNPKPTNLRFRRIKQNIPDFLIRITTGKQVLYLVTSAYAFSCNHDDPKSQVEVDLIGGFLQEINDWGNISRDLEPGYLVKVAFNLTSLIEELEEAGFFVFGGREVQRLEGGKENESFPWLIAIIHVLRKDNSEIIYLD